MTETETIVERHSTRELGIDSGSAAVMFALLIVPLLAIVAVVTEVGVVYAHRQQLQSGVEAAALAAARDWTRGSNPCTDISGYISANNTLDPNSGEAVTSSCTTTGDNRNGTITITAEAQAALIFGGITGRDTAGITATASVAIGSPASTTGLRPLAICATHPALQTWTNSGFTDSSVHRIDIESDGTSCAGDVPGNWAMIDFDGGNNSNSTLQSWVVNGYPGAVDVPSTVAGDPGIPTPAIDLDSLVGSTVRFPVFSAARDNGSGSEFDLTGFVAAEVVEVVMTGSASNRHIDLRFVTERDGDERTDRTRNCQYGISSWHLCALDGNGTCS